MTVTAPVTAPNGPVKEQLTVAVHHPTDHRPHAPEFQALIDELNTQIVRTVHGLGWTAQLYAGDRMTPAASRAAADADLVVIAGGEDVTPALYGEDDMFPGRDDHVTDADIAQLQVIREAAGKGTPLLGICRGLQLINVAFGGTLVQDMTSDPGFRGHNHRGEGDPFVRTAVSPVSPVSAVGTGPRIPEGVLPAGDGLCTHHQAVGRLGSGLCVVARADDGTVEALVHEDAPVTGVQWHPEHPAVADTQLTALLHSTVSGSRGGQSLLRSGVSGSPSASSSATWSRRPSSGVQPSSHSPEP